MPGPTREYQFVTGVETSTQPTATQTPTDDNDLVTKQFVSAVETHTFKLFGPLSATNDRIDGYHISDTAKSLERIRIYIKNPSDTDTFTIRYQINDAGSQTDSFSTTAATDYAENRTLTTPEAMAAGDRLSIDITAIAGSIDELYIVCYFS